MKGLVRAANALILVLAAIGIVSIGAIFFIWRMPPMTEDKPVRAALPVLTGSERTADDRYLALLKKYLTRYDFGGKVLQPMDEYNAARKYVGRYLRSRGVVLAKVKQQIPETREEGRDYPATAETMIGLKRLDNLQECITDVLRKGVQGDFLEAGAWRGGATIFMRAMLQVNNVKDRVVWVADSFEGLPKPDEINFPADKGDLHYTRSDVLAVGVDQVKANFRRYGLLDDQVKFLVGWFKDTLPKSPVEKLAILRLDADMYESTTEALQYLYSKLSVGGYCIIDDYGAVVGCKRAVQDFRKAQNITDELKQIDWTGVYWQKTM